LGRVSDNKIEDVRLAIGSMAVTPLRLRRTEEVLSGQAWSPALVGEARQAMEKEVAPIDDIRSSADYRLHVAGNLLQEFLEGLFQ
jgi:xanthine dehydrogenase small subunit